VNSKNGLSSSKRVVHHEQHLGLEQQKTAQYKGRSGGDALDGSINKHWSGTQGSIKNDKIGGTEGCGISSSG